MAQRSSSVHPFVKLLQQIAEPRYDGLFITLLLIAEVILSAVIIQRVAYTEIDWVAYMEEVEGWWVDGIYDYRQLRGGTGPLVYPAGFLYLFAVLRQMTDLGTNVLRAQYIFGAFYLLQLLVVLMIYTQILRCRSRGWKAVWSWRIAMGLLCLSKRMHSIFVLRLFNDGLAMLFLYISVYLFARNIWKWGCFWFSVAVSIKMNVLLFAPGLLLLLLQTHPSYVGTIVCLSICASIQLILGAPFLLSYPEAYLRKAFELDRVFFYKWTVNWKFLEEETFVSKPLSLLLLAFHLGGLVYLAAQWVKCAKTSHNQRLFFGKPLSPDYVVYTMLLSNFIGIAFARTLHYQFYSWYFHAIPLLLWISPTYPLLIRIVICGVIEYAFNIFPATPVSSALLQLAHLAVLIGLKSPGGLNMDIIEAEKAKDKKQD
mmetsp:Transcript_18913/g.31285  ORF Transcript_18913/g.31285 Transcript_18913/m.31285 type:complete len:427 (-) Transcript_18913:54-1334(-)|eukprot:CAMPEP_0119008796 /NCGR_PEP_ID=MMETSP1176-20130426/3943_1 /TAXON_ID=265551 /ORGANISM="Synedropsis recta cf, Strain CCMP1620" /LENGTH=426 /DNA_ID=CAMNT_0006961197 /DNA_START=65 /DNA_END=1345 /DNA_ORIENTATION=-